jgi:hypothetical protein
MKRNRRSAQIAQITGIDSGPNGYTLTIGHGPGNASITLQAGPQPRHNGQICSTTASVDH